MMFKKRFTQEIFSEETKPTHLTIIASVTLHILTILSKVYILSYGNLLDYISTLQEELVRAGVLESDYDFERHRELFPM